MPYRSSTWLAKQSFEVLCAGMDSFFVRSIANTDMHESAKVTRVRSTWREASAVACFGVPLPNVAPAQIMIVLFPQDGMR